MKWFILLWIFRVMELKAMRGGGCHLKLMPTTSLPHILHNEETRDHTFDYIFHSQLKKLLLNFSGYFIVSQSVVICHVHLCIVINHSLSLYHCWEHKPTFQIINNWWLKYKIFLISLKYSYNCTQKSKKTILCCFHFWSSQLTFYHNWFSIGYLGKHHIHSTGLISVILSFCCCWSNYIFFD